MSNKLVKDYLGNLVPRAKARKILDKFYVEGESCFLMPDNQWYRITSSDKIVFDHYHKAHVLKESSKLIEGFINNKGDKGMFSDNPSAVLLRDSRGGVRGKALDESIAIGMGYIESISDGIFYLSKNITDDDKKAWFYRKNIPSDERSKSYNVESNPEKKRTLQKNYDELDIKISAQSKRIGKLLGDYTIGAEFEVINGFLPARIRDRYGFKNLKDGSLRSNEGEGQEYASAIMSGPKCVQVLKEVCKEFTRRCEINNFCSLHFHFGNVKKDKIYTLAIFRLVSMIQNELVTYFPYSRFNSIKDDGKIYCKPLPNLGIDYGSIMKAGEEEVFRKRVFTEFNKIYTWLNNGKGLAEEISAPIIQKEIKIIGGKKMFATSWMRNVYTTKSIHGSVQGEKWNKLVRYHNVNLLNLFFTKLETIEFRCMEGTTNFTKTAIWLLTCASILRYAEDTRSCFTKTSITLEEILQDHLGKELAEYCMEYYKARNRAFFVGGGYKSGFASVEKKWFKDDEDFTFKHNNIELV